MPKRMGIEVSVGVAEAVKACDVDVISAYPITPQTHIVEHLSEIVAEGHLDAEFIMVESEHTAMAACCGASAAGARTFTATASQGLQLMSEIVFIASGLRMPIVMAVANRSLAAPLSIWGDHSDIMANRDCGWISIFVENGQAAHDNTFVCFKIAEDPRVMLPVMLNLDGFQLTHVVEPIEIIDRSELGNFLPPFTPKIQLNPLQPVTMGPASTPAMYTEAKKAQEEAIKGSRAVIDNAWKEFAKKFGRQYKAVETYDLDDAETVLVMMGSMSGTAHAAVKEMRKAGRKVGLVNLRLFRPFPADDLRKILGGFKSIAVCERAISFGGPGGPLASELKTAFYGQPKTPYISSFVLGLAGRDVRTNHFEHIVERAEQLAAKGEPAPYEIVGLRE